MSSAAEQLEFVGVETQCGGCHRRPAQSVLPSDLQVDELDLPAVIVQRGADEAEDLLVDTETSRISVDGPGHRHQHQAVGGRQRLEPMGLQVGAEKEPFFPG